MRGAGVPGLGRSLEEMTSHYAAWKTGPRRELVTGHGSKELDTTESSLLLSFRPKKG